ncbi:MAG: MFS transporter [Parvibaculaceae bacterium]
MTSTTAGTLADRPAVGSRGTIVAATIGNMFECFDLIIFGIMAGVIAKLYFPATDDSTSLLLFLGTFGVTFFMRPVGAIILGNLGDKVGRKKIMSLSLLLMTVGMLIIALTPDYSSIGLAAPLAIVAGRMLQGFSAGGEYGSATALLAEHNPHRRGFIASWQTATQGFAMMLAAAFGAALTWSLSPADFESWGWRVPFLFGALLGPIGVYIRRSTGESEEFSRATPAKQPMLEVFSAQKTRVLISTGLIILATIGMWMSIFMPTYVVKHFNADPASGFIGAIVTGAIVFVLSPPLGRLSDSIGRTPTMIVSSIACMFLAYPLFLVLQRFPTIAGIIAVQAVMGILIALYFAPLPALMAEIFPAKTRTSGLSLSYNVGVTIFGGFAPFVMSGLATLTANPLAPSFYLMFAGAASAVAIWGARTALQLR